MIMVLGVVWLCCVAHGRCGGCGRGADISATIVDLEGEVQLAVKFRP